MKKILLELVGFYETLEPIDKASIAMIILLVIVCIIAYYDTRKLDKDIRNDLRFLKKKYRRKK